MRCIPARILLPVSFCAGLRSLYPASPLSLNAMLGTESQPPRADYEHDTTSVIDCKHETSRLVARVGFEPTLPCASGMCLLPVGLPRHGEKDEDSRQNQARQAIQGPEEGW